MSFVRTFFNKPLLDEFGLFARSVLAIDFDDVSVLATKSIGEDDHKLGVLMAGGQEMVFSGRSRVEFLEVFEEYCRAMQSLERGAIGFFTKQPEQLPPIEPPKISAQVVVNDPKKGNP